MLRQGYLELKLPTRLGWVVLDENEFIHDNENDVIALSFVVHNNKNSFRPFVCSFKPRSQE